MAAGPVQGRSRSVGGQGSEGTPPRRRERGRGRRRSPLAQYGTDLTRRAGAGGLDRVVGRSTETMRVAEILLRRRKNNPLLVGDAGVGKTAIVEGLAQRIASGNAPEQLLGKRLITLDMAGMIAGARYRGEFEMRVKRLLSEVIEADDVILFIDEIHSILGAGGPAGAMDAAGLLKPALARGQVRLIGATTWKEYRRFFVRDATLQRRFQVVAVEEPDRDDALAVLEGLRETYEEFHGLPITDGALNAAVLLSDRYIPDRRLPDKAIDLIDEASARRKADRLMPPAEITAMRQELGKRRQRAVEAAADETADMLEIYAAESRLRERLISARRLWYRDLQQNAEPIDEQAVAEVAAGWTGIALADLTSAETDRYIQLEERLARGLVGQDEAVQEVARALKRAAAGLKEPARPVGALLLVGPSGVGKTELASLLAEFVAGDRDRLIRIDMAELAEPFAAARLIGAPPGYVGYEEAGRLTEAVRRDPYSVVLFDDVEKAHPQVLALLLQIMDSGTLTDAAGREASFANCVILLTSNSGGSRAPGIGFGDRSHGGGPDREHLIRQARRQLPPEFVNRLDSIVAFRDLAEEDFREIARRLLSAMVDRAGAKGVEVEIDGAVLSDLVSRAVSAGEGARPLRTLIERQIEELLAAELIAGGDTPPLRLRLGLDGETFTVSDPAGPAA